MSGRTFTYQGNYDDFVRYLLPDVEMSDRRKSVGIGDSMLREVEEFLNRFVVTAVNDAGDIIFDAAGSYTFQGDVIIGGELQSSNWVDDTVGWQLRSDGTFEFNSSGDVRGDLGVHGDMTMFTGGAMKTNASGLRAEISEATTSTSIVGGSADFAGVDLFTGDAGELEPGLLGVSNSAAGYSTVVLAGADLAGAAQRSYVYFSSTTAGNTETRLSDPSRTYLTAGSSSVDINQTGINVNVADGDLDLAVKNLPSGSYQDKINLAEDLFTVTLSNAERMRLDTTGLKVDTDTLVVDSTNNRVGIGDASPTKTLHVNSGTINQTSVFESTDGTAWIGIKDSASSSDLHVAVGAVGNEMRLRAGNANRVAIDANGNVGIKTTNPESILHLNPGTDVTPDGNGVGHIMIDGSGYTSFFTMDGTGTWIGNNSTSRSMILATNETARLTVLGGGDVGIGTTSPTQKLDVNGNLRIRTGVDGGIEFRPWTASSSYNSMANTNHTGGEYTMLTTASATFLSVGAGGSVNIRPNGNEVSGLSVQTTGTFIIAKFPGVSGYSTVRRRSSDGLLGYASSSQRYKENIVDADDTWRRIYDLRPRDFDWRESMFDTDPTGVPDDRSDYGLIAEEAHLVMPSIVEWAVPNVETEVDEHNEPIPPETPPDPIIEAVDYEKLSRYFLPAIQDLNARVAALEA